MERFDINKVKVGDKVLVCHYTTTSHSYKIDTIVRITKTTIALEKDTLYIYNADGDVRGNRARRYLLPYDEEFYRKWKNEHDEEVARREVINKIKAINLEVLPTEKLKDVLDLLNA